MKQLSIHIMESFSSNSFANNMALLNMSKSSSSNNNNNSNNKKSKKKSNNKSSIDDDPIYSVSFKDSEYDKMKSVLDKNNIFYRDDYFEENIVEVPRKQNYEKLLQVLKANHVEFKEIK